MKTLSGHQINIEASVPRDDMYYIKLWKNCHVFRNITTENSKKRLLHKVVEYLSKEEIYNLLDFYPSIL